MAASEPGLAARVACVAGGEALERGHLIAAAEASGAELEAEVVALGALPEMLGAAWAAALAGLAARKAESLRWEEQTVAAVLMALRGGLPGAAAAARPTRYPQHQATEEGSSQELLVATGTAEERHCLEHLEERQPYLSGALLLLVLLLVTPSHAAYAWHAH